MSTNSALMRFVATSLVVHAQTLHQLLPVCPGGLVLKVVLDHPLDLLGQQSRNAGAPLGSQDFSLSDQFLWQAQGKV